MKSQFLALLAILALGSPMFAQQHTYNAYGIKGGMTVGLQKWNGSTGSNQELFEPLGNGSLFGEFDADGKGSIIGLDLGYHVRGSAINQRATSYIDATGRVVDLPARVYKTTFSNVVLGGFFKKIYDIGNGFGGYYLLGARLEYTVRDSFPFEYTGAFLHQGLQRINYGLSAGGGIEKRLGKSPILAQLELQIQPDFSKQILSPAFPYYDPYTRQNVAFPEQNVLNTTFELTLGLKYAEYTDE